MSIAIVDIDHFKSINDTFGHPAGDAVLQETTRRVRAVLREPDLVGRFGGEELICLLPATPKVQAEAIAERIRQMVAATPIQVGRTMLYQTLSLGLATSPEDGADLAQLTAEADRALYAAKRAGRNRVMAGRSGGSPDVASA